MKTEAGWTNGVTTGPCKEKAAPIGLTHFTKLCVLSASALTSVGLADEI